MYGWYQPPTARRAHFFDAMSRHSQCGRYFYTERGDRAEGAHRCKECARGMGDATIRVYGHLIEGEEAPALELRRVDLVPITQEGEDHERLPAEV